MGKLYPTSLHLYFDLNIWHNVPNLPFYIKENSITLSPQQPFSGKRSQQTISITGTLLCQKRFNLSFLLPRSTLETGMLLLSESFLHIIVFDLLIIYGNDWLRFYGCQCFPCNCCGIIVSPLFLLKLAIDINNKLNKN